MSCHVIWFLGCGVGVLLMEFRFDHRSATRVSWSTDLSGSPKSVHYYQYIAGCKVYISVHDFRIAPVILCYSYLACRSILCSSVKFETTVFWHNCIDLFIKLVFVPVDSTSGYCPRIIHFIAWTKNKRHTGVRTRKMKYLKTGQVTSGHIQPILNGDIIHKSGLTH